MDSPKYLQVFEAVADFTWPPFEWHWKLINITDTLIRLTACSLWPYVILCCCSDEKQDSQNPSHISGRTLWFRMRLNCFLCHEEMSFKRLWHWMYKSTLQCCSDCNMRSELDNDQQLCPVLALHQSVENTSASQYI